MIATQGFEDLCLALELNMESRDPLVVHYAIGAKDLGRFTKQEFMSLSNVG